MSCSSALYLTASASNLLSLKLAESLGVKLHKSWLTWFKVTCIPGFVSLALLPFVVYKIFPPEIKETPDAPTVAKAKLKEMGPVKMSEWVMVITMLITVGLWVSGEHLEIPAVVAALVGLSLLLLFGVIDWQDCLGEKSAWDTLVWFGVLVGMATQLNNLGVVPWLSLSISNSLKSLSLSWFGAFVILHLSYFALHYLFASQTAHVGALYSAFLGMLLAAKVPPLMAALSLAVNTNLFGALTHYSSGQAAVYYGAGYVKLPRVFRMGIMVAIINIIIWSLTAAAWWKILGLY
ncbi:primary active transporter [Lithospermum erythrorhizon]|uniref:Primary active transporter n=1 Tax=Lithospermum erythrorhizon TaxID=34254 RepID=A0AAV3QGA5_LITER